MKIRHILPLLALLSLTLVIAAEPKGRTANNAAEMSGAEKIVYKTIGDTKLSLYVCPPKEHKPGDKRPAIVFFHGGGWRNGAPSALLPQCRYFAHRGLVAVTVQYRLAPAVKVDGCVRDAVSAMRWVRAHAAQLGIDPDRIAAGGGSAGGHLAAATGLLERFDEPGEDAKISSKPNALMLFNPALMLAPVKDAGVEFSAAMKEATMKERTGVAPEMISPYHHITAGAPPTIIMHGTADTTVPFATVELFTKTMRAAGNRCELVPYKDRKHSFFNFGKSREDFVSTMQDSDKFLASLGWLKGPPEVEKFLADFR